MVPEHVAEHWAGVWFDQSAAEHRSIGLTVDLFVAGALDAIADDYGCDDDQLAEIEALLRDRLVV